MSQIEPAKQTTKVFKSDQPALIDPALIEDVVRPSFNRCCADSSEFFDDFYFRLGNRLPDVGALFAQVDMEKQNELIREGIADLIAYASGDSNAEAELRRLAKSHSRSGLGVAPEYYPHWIDSLMKTMREYDPDATDDTEVAWRRVLASGIELMIAGY
ncbi:MAG: globin [Rhodopirellula sp.]|nr:globin [Rhodopirellula sp.]